MVCAVRRAFKVGQKFFVIDRGIVFLLNLSPNYSVKVAYSRELLRSTPGNICVPADPETHVKLHKRLVQQCPQAVVH